MSEHRFTAGPWRVNTGGSQMCDPGTTICFAEGVGVFSDADYHGDKLADAHLIAAAPELLEALARLLKWVEPIAGDNRDKAAEAEEIASVEQARAAIAKATGAQA